MSKWRDSVKLHTELDQAISRLAGWDYDEGYGWDDGEARRPSSNENDAGCILDRIAALGWMVTVFTGPHWDSGVSALIRCCILRGVGGPMVDVVAETRPLAICRAFIQAMERWSDGPAN